MTSPSWPVTCRPGSPSMPVTSIVSTSPPAPGDGQAGRQTRDRRPRRVLRAGSAPGRGTRATSASSTTTGVAPPFRDASRRLARDRAELPFEPTHAGFSRPSRDDRVERGVGDRRARRRAAPPSPAGAGTGGAWRSRPSRPRCSRRAARSPCGRAAAPGIVSSTFAVARNKHVGEVEVELEVVVAERVVLRGVEHLQQRRRGIAAPAAGLQLVDLVDQQHRVHRAGFGERAHDATRAATRRRYAGDRGSRLRHGRHRPRPARTGGRGRARPTRRATSCRRRAGRRARGSHPNRDR